MPAVFVKAPVFPFRRFPGVDPVLGPEMKSTGEVMGVDASFGAAFAKAWIAAGNPLPLAGTAFLSVHDRDKAALVPVAERLAELGFELVATAGTADFLAAHGVSAVAVLKVHEGRPNVVDAMINREIDLVINTPLGRESQRRRRLHPAHRAALRRPLHHHPLGRPRGGRGHRGAPRRTLGVHSLQELQRLARAEANLHESPLV